MYVVSGLQLRGLPLTDVHVFLSNRLFIKSQALSRLRAVAHTHVAFEFNTQLLKGPHLFHVDCAACKMISSVLIAAVIVLFPQGL